MLVEMQLKLGAAVVWLRAAPPNRTTATYSIVYTPSLRVFLPHPSLQIDVRCWAAC